MRCPKNHITVRVGQKSIDELFIKKVTRVDGSEVNMAINSQAEDIDDRVATLFVQVGIVEMVGKDVSSIFPGDIAIISYEIFHDTAKIISKDDTGIVFLVNPFTKYHAEDNLAFGNQVNSRMQLVWEKGEVDETSQLLAIVRDGMVFTNDPYVFVHYVTNKQTGQAWIVEEEEKDIVKSRVVSISDKSAVKYGVNQDDFIYFRYADCFDIKLGDKSFVVLNDSDMLIVEPSIMKAV